MDYICIETEYGMLRAIKHKNNCLFLASDLLYILGFYQIKKDVKRLINTEECFRIKYKDYKHNYPCLILNDGDMSTKTLITQKQALILAHNAKRSGSGVVFINKYLPKVLKRLIFAF